MRELPDEYAVTALSGTSGGAICAALAWDGLRRDDPDGALARLEGFWDDIAASTPWERLLNDAVLWGGRLTGGVGAFRVSPYHSPASLATHEQLRETIERYVALGDDARASPPHLYIGAVDVESGSFRVFRDGEEGVTALLASAAIPTLYRAVEIDGAGHWDGLFSQNPPIRYFTSELPADEKPDEIWVVRINPVERDETPRSLDDIEDRRNELSGNLALAQEKHTVESITDLVADGVIEDDRYKEIAVREVAPDEQLDLQSKLDRDPSFLRDLQERGQRRAGEFWTETPAPTAPER